ncbi:SpoIID/LytB domain-containing protein [Planctomycetota bacterium]
MAALITIYGCSERKLVKQTPQMDADSRFWVRVLLLDDVRECTLMAETSLNLTDFATGASQAEFQNSDMPLSVTISSGKIAINGCSFPTKKLIITPQSPHIFNLNGQDYRGKLSLILNADGESLDAVNMVPLEPYLAGVVGSEMPYYWEPEALKVQAIAARTYCLYTKRRFGKNRHWDVTKTAANQVYGGVGAESAKIWKAVNKTWSLVLASKRTDSIFPAYYSSICGGHTEDSQNVFGESFDSLGGVLCPYCKQVAKPRFFFWPMVKFDKTKVTQKLLQKYPALKELGEIKNIIPARKSDYGEFSRLTMLKLLGSAGKTEFLRAEDLRLTIDPTGRLIKSAICQIVDMTNKWAFVSGRGFGHGVGMCQCGAQAMARNGKTARQILFYYYPDSKIINIYKN